MNESASTRRRPWALATHLHGRDNNFNLIRFVAAASVILFHSYALLGHPEGDLLRRSTGGVVDFGYLGVIVFFVVSGFLVTMSFVRQDSVVAFVAARVLRIYPGLALAALLTVAIGAVCSTLPWRSFLTDPQTVDYLRFTVSGWDVRDRLPGVFAGSPYPHAVNGSLWTLPIELKFYVGCLAAGVCGLLRRAWRFNVAFAAATVVFAWHPEWFPVHPELPVVRHFAIVFALGAFAWMNREWLPLSLWLAGVAVILLLTNPLGFGRGVYFLAIVVYLVLVFALHPALRLSAFNRLGDYSYGLYVYAFPVQQMLIYRWPDTSPPILFWSAFSLTLVLAIASWHLVEEPMLGLKSRLARRSPEAPRRENAQRPAARPS